MENNLPVLRDERKLFISRVPKETKDLFIELADGEFAEDYGLTLKWALEQALEYQNMKSTFFENINLKLNEILEKVAGPTIHIPEPEKKINLLSGKKIKIKGRNNSDGSTK